ncbi:hypothetical protein HPB51_024357 [Rhipicephalus microplus]|uniref:Uncharacterized protein n=1 Tax=Rhipicephalus microplus TaxID=6941 RepID=A0A9J6D8A1_RHIMP|nr:hypothetical protein HPB51_024357 [Rhipicephalus microplus]
MTPRNGIFEWRSTTPTRQPSFGEVINLLTNVRRLNRNVSRGATTVAPAQRRRHLPPAGQDQGRTELPARPVSALGCVSVVRPCVRLEHGGSPRQRWEDDEALLRFGYLRRCFPECAARRKMVSEHSRAPCQRAMTSITWGQCQDGDDLLMIAQRTIRRHVGRHARARRPRIVSANSV